MKDSVTLSNGLKMPLVGLGTWRLVGKECTKAVSEALEIGYRHIDTAHVYENHAAIGEAIRDFPRKELFITSKVWYEQLDPDTIEKGVDRALNELETDYLDLYLIHWPDRKKPMAEVLSVMNKLVEKGKLKAAGVSNFTIHHLQDLLAKGIKPMVNQVEFHPYLYQKELLDFCKKQEIALSAYRPLAKGAFVKEPILQKIGEKHGKNACQVCLRWMVQREIPVIPKSSGKKHLEENLALFDFTLNKEEMAQIDALNRNERFCDGDWTDFDY
jgi:diketogulonate reductase-like aldo/keto reductase